MGKAKLKKVDVELKFPFVGSLTGSWEADEAQQIAAWEAHVELVTRVTVVPLRADEGLLREALESMHSLFETTREILRRHGPGIAKASKPEMLSFASIAVAVLNRGIRPLLATWHPRLTDFKALARELMPLLVTPLVEALARLGPNAQFLPTHGLPRQGVVKARRRGP